MIQSKINHFYTMFVIWDFILAPSIMFLFPYSLSGVHQYVICQTAIKIQEFVFKPIFGYVSVYETSQKPCCLQLNPIGDHPSARTPEIIINWLYFMIPLGSLLTAGSNSGCQLLIQ